MVSSGRRPALQVWSPEFKPSSAPLQKFPIKWKLKVSDQEHVHLLLCIMILLPSVDQLGEQHNEFCFHKADHGQIMLKAS
jgi:hypothetical protein